MTILIRNAKVYYHDEIKEMDVLIADNGKIDLEADNTMADEVIDGTGKYLLPGLVDVHTHFREPGFEYKETIRSGSMAALKGGVTTAFMMPNLKPCMDNIEAYREQLKRIEESGLVNLYQIAAITRNEAGAEMSDIAELSTVCKWFSDDGKGVQDEEMMLEAMKLVKEHDGIITAHCEDESELPPKGSINLGKKSEEFGLAGINNASEYNEVIRGHQAGRGDRMQVPYLPYVS